MNLIHYLFALTFLFSTTLVSKALGTRNLEDTPSEAKAVPYVDPQTGKVLGHVIQSPESFEHRGELELRQGDVLTEVNGIKLDSAENGQRAFRQLRNGKGTVKLKRNGEKIIMNNSKKQ